MSLPHFIRKYYSEETLKATDKFHSDMMNWFDSLSEEEISKLSFEPIKTEYTIHKFNIGDDDFNNFNN